MPFPCVRSERVADHGRAGVVVNQHEPPARVCCACVHYCVSVIGAVCDGRSFEDVSGLLDCELLHVVLSLVMEIGGLRPSAGVGCVVNVP